MSVTKPESSTVSLRNRMINQMANVAVSMNRTWKIVKQAPAAVNYVFEKSQSKNILGPSIDRKEQS